MIPPVPHPYLPRLRLKGLARRYWPLALPLACLAVPAQAQGSYLRAEDFRVATIGYRLATADPSLCVRQGPVTGILLHHLAEYDRADRPGLIAQGMNRGPGVLAVVAGSPAEAAGLRAGDVLLSVDGKPFDAPATIAASSDSDIWRPLVEASETKFQEALAHGPVTLTVLRAGETRTLTLTTTNGCPLRIRLARSTQRTAVADGPYVIVTTALLAMAQNDDELAFTIGHELAHVVLGHGAWLKQQGVPRSGPLRALGKNGAKIRATEEAADQLGGRLTIAAHYDLARGAEILRRFGPDLSFGLLQTHDRDGDRIRALRLLAAGTAAPRP